MYILLEKVRMLLEWADGLQTKMLDGWWSEVEWMDGYPLDCYDYKSTSGAEKYDTYDKSNFQQKHFTTKPD